MEISDKNSAKNGISFEEFIRIYQQQEALDLKNENKIIENDISI